MCRRSGVGAIRADGPRRRDRAARWRGSLRRSQLGLALEPGLDLGVDVSVEGALRGGLHLGHAGEPEVRRHDLRRRPDAVDRRRPVRIGIIGNPEVVRGRLVVDIGGLGEVGLRFASDAGGSQFRLRLRRLSVRQRTAEYV